MKEFAEKIPAEVKAEVEKAVAEVKAALEKDDVALIRSATETLGQTVQRIGGSMYDANNPQTGAPTGEQIPPDGEVVDGEVKE